MKLSIIIPTFNSAKVIGRALDSIVNQIFDDWEVLVMDGASTDGTANVVKSFNDKRIKFYSESDKGIYDAMNKGIRRSQGEWLYFLGSDDWLYDKDVLACFFRDNDFSQYDVVYGDVNAPHLNERNQGEWSLDSLMYNRCHQAIFYKKYLFAKFGYYNLKYKVWADFDFNLKWFLNVKTKSSYVSKSISFFSADGISSQEVDSKFIKDYYKLLCLRGRKKMGDDLYLEYLDKWAYSKKKEKKWIIVAILVIYAKIYHTLRHNS